MFGGGVKRIMLWCERVDMRQSFNGLLSLTRNRLMENSKSGDLYVFVSKSGKYIKCLYWDRTGFCIVSKKLEVGRVRHNWSDKKELSKEVFYELFDGVIR
jgi:transposase